MGRICDRSPCDSLLNSLGVWIHGYTDGFYVEAVVTGEIIESPEFPEFDIDYCPFCGTRLEEVGGIEKYLKPKKRRRETKIGAA